ncbi:Lipoxygenase 2 [Forsythia ovata]|uniref:Lipoxygenase n=1 Tax=Forsythia ovata TaxID=205694 RepID=A0ABD1RHR5_9LAMI
MLNQINISKSQYSHQILLPNYKPFIVGTGGNACFAVTPKFKSVRQLENVRVGRASRTIKAVQTSNEKSTTSTTATIVAVEITVLKTLGGVLRFGKTLHVELVAASYLPSQTPSGLISYREKELQILRGDGTARTGELKTFERIYDYDVYNDLGDPDSSDDLWRPVLGGKERPYPRRCRTGRARSKIDPLSESRSTSAYVPRDETFSEVKQKSFWRYSTQWKEVFRPSWEASDLWLWRLAKAHVLAHDSGYHQLVSHWLRTHCCVEPYIIATNRHLSAMHPIHRLLHPHLRYTMEINALSRELLINADGTIEKSFFPYKYSIEISSVVYDQLWQFDLQALPADLISRGMAVEDPTALYRLKLTIEDYPYANDGLLIWDAIEKWVTKYVTYYYSEEEDVNSDNELKAWWTEIRTVGHGDKKDEPGWPKLNTPKHLIGILTNMIWIASGHHAAVNFGQYDFAGYFPNQPTIARTNMPTEDPNDSEKEEFLKRPEEFLLKCFPSQVQAKLVMAILHALSSHSPDEEYLGQTIQPYWKEDDDINNIFKEFSGKLKEIEGIIDARNADSNLKNRFGAGVVPYQLLKPFSKEGVTGMGVPNSISI